MIPFTQSLLYQHSLDANSVVLEIGTNTGGFAKTWAESYGCHVLTYEPIKEFYDQAMLNFALPPLSELVRVEQKAVGAANGKAVFRVHGEMSGQFADGQEQEVEVVSIKDVLDHPWVTNRTIDLLSINCEGGEFGILEAILNGGLECFFQRIQVQPHSVVPDAVNRWAKIRERLLVSFEITSEDPNLDNGWLLLKRR